MIVVNDALVFKPNVTSVIAVSIAIVFARRKGEMGEKGGREGWGREKEWGRKGGGERIGEREREHISTHQE